MKSLVLALCLLISLGSFASTEFKGVVKAAVSKAQFNNYAIQNQDTGEMFSVHVAKNDTLSNQLLASSINGQTLYVNLNDNQVPKYKIEGIDISFMGSYFLSSVSNVSQETFSELFEDKQK